MSEPQPGVAHREAERRRVPRTQRVKLECVVKRVEPGRGMAVSFSSADLGPADIASVMENPPKK